MYVQTGCPSPGRRREQPAEAPGLTVEGRKVEQAVVGAPRDAAWSRDLRRDEWLSRHSGTHRFSFA